MNPISNAGSSVFHAKLSAHFKSEPSCNTNFLKSRRDALVEDAKVLSKVLLSRNIQGEENIRMFLENDPDAPRFRPMSIVYQRALIAMSQ